MESLKAAGASAAVTSSSVVQATKSRLGALWARVPSVTVPESVKALPGRAFGWCRNHKLATLATILVPVAGGAAWRYRQELNDYYQSWRKPATPPAPQSSRDLQQLGDALQPERVEGVLSPEQRKAAVALVFKTAVGKPVNLDGDGTLKDKLKAALKPTGKKAKKGKKGKKAQKGAVKVQCRNKDLEARCVQLAKGLDLAAFKAAEIEDLDGQLDGLRQRADFVDAATPYLRDACRELLILETLDQHGAAAEWAVALLATQKLLNA